jgi:hypothetical protein
MGWRDDDLSGLIFCQGSTDDKIKSFQAIKANHQAGQIRQLAAFVWLRRDSPFSGFGAAG